MAEVTRETVEEAIKGYIEPHLEPTWSRAKSIKDVEIDGGKVKVDVQLGFPGEGRVTMTSLPRSRPLSRRSMASVPAR